MKIINKTYRDVGEGESPIQKTPITELQTATDLTYGSLIHIVTKNADDKYESQKMTTDTFKQKIYDAVQNTFKTSYWDTHELKEDKTPSDKHDQGEDPNRDRPEGTSFADLLSFLDGKDKRTTGNIKYVPEEVSDTDPNGFVDHLYYDFDLIKRYMVVKDSDIEKNINTINGNIDELGCLFSTEMDYATTKLNNNLQETIVTSDTIGQELGENDNYCQMSIESGNKISNEWTCPASGNLVVYGWLDSSDCLNNKATPSAFCVIEGNINGNWEIISACPVTPAKSITYVGFNLTVKKGLVIRARTGFICGVKSSQFPNQQDGYDTLSNSKANGFKCMIYSNKKGTEDDDDSGQGEEG
jgi:hypothetical protein